MELNELRQLFNPKFADDFLNELMSGRKIRKTINQPDMLTELFLQSLALYGYQRLYQKGYYIKWDEWREQLFTYLTSQTELMEEIKTITRKYKDQYHQQGA